MKKIALITGASSGIGEAIAKILARNHYNLIITGRRMERLEKLAESLISTYKIEVLALNFDVRDRNQTNDVLKNIPENFKNIDILVNNAGLAAGFGLIQDGSVDDWETMLDTNVKGLLYVSRALIPGMTERKSGHIVNISSIAGKETYQSGNVYCASKHAVESLTKAMRIDLLSHGIKVTSIAPGMVETEFAKVRFKGDEQAASAVYKGFVPLAAQDVAEALEFVVTRPAHVNINEILIMPTAQANTAYVYKQL
jgi:NADP-dependent 3-hydroxy acid dehydrogenase YdfG